MASAWDFEGLVARYYEPLYQFAFSLTRSEADACDLTQQTFYVWATKGHQLRDPEKVKTWLFTTLHRQFLESRRRQVRFPHQDLDASEIELPAPTGGSDGLIPQEIAGASALTTIDPPLLTGIDPLTCFLPTVSR